MHIGNVGLTSVFVHINLKRNGLEVTAAIKWVCRQVMAGK